MQIAASNNSGYLHAIKKEQSPPNEDPITAFLIRDCYLFYLVVVR